jgi:hypothetical protein
MKIAILILALAYALVCLVAFLLQSRLVFFPARALARTPGDAGMDFRDVTFATATGRTLHGWMVPAVGSTYTLLYCHGNAGNIGDRIESIRQFVEMGLSVFIFDYGGYGRSEGRPGEASTYEDALAAWEHLTGAEGIANDRIVVFGRSLGGAVAIDLVAGARRRQSPAGLIVESCFTSLPDLGARVYKWLPVRFLCRYRYNNWKKIRDVGVPKLFIHSLEDEVVPFGMGKRLYNHASRPKQFLRIRGGHNDGYLASDEQYREGVRAFIAILDQPRVRRDMAE